MRQQDLNLLVIFDAIMTEGAITRAAERLSMTQPAVSNALSRMRVAWKDELFLKDGRGVQPTVFAKNLWSQIRTPLSQLEHAVDPTTFDPATEHRTFRIAASDVTVDATWGILAKKLEEVAPNINISTVPANMNRQNEMLHNAEVDLMIGKNIDLAEAVRSEHLMTPHFVVAMGHNHPIAQAKNTIDVEDFIAAQHLMISSSDNTSDITDSTLTGLGLKRRVAMSINQFSPAPAILKQSNLIAVLPSAAIEREIISGELAIYELPIELPPLQVSLLWHKRQDHDLGLSWLRNILGQLIRDDANRHLETVTRFCRECCQQQKDAFAREQGEFARLSAVE